jgi:predicted nucleic acid-binding protein
MSQAQFLIDTSALVRVLQDEGILAQWSQPLRAGLIATCAITELEVLYTARSKSNREHLLDLLRELFGWVVMPERSFERAAEVQAGLTARGSHRSASPVDLLTAAAAEAHGLVVLHFDADFSQISAVTGQPVRWLADPGSVD